MIVIGAGHRAQQGKSLFCEAITEQCSRRGIRCKEYSISEEILVYCIANGFLSPGLTRATCSPEQVDVLIKVANEKRDYDECFWTDKIVSAISADEPKVALVPNIRFPQEAKIVKDLGGVNVGVTRFNADGSHYFDPTRNPNDVTETALEFFPWDFRIANLPHRPFWLRRQAISLFDYLIDGGE